MNPAAFNHLYGQDVNRASGRTTRLALKYLLQASNNPGVPIALSDHHDSKVADQCLGFQVQRLASAMPSPETWVFSKKDGDLYLTFMVKA